MIEYEVYKDSSNAKVMYDYGDQFSKTLSSIPLVLYTPPTYDLGDADILANFDNNIKGGASNSILLANKSVSWQDLNLNDFEGKPQLFIGDRAVVKDSNNDISDTQNSLIKEFLTTTNLDNFVTTIQGTKAGYLTVQYPGGEEDYTHGVTIGSWTLLWRGNNDAQIVASTDNSGTNTQTNSGKISWLKVSTLALTDSINPCALSVLLMMLIAIATYHPKDRKQILWAGIAFVGAVFITYFIYGLLIVRAFQFIQAISGIRIYLYKGLGIVAIILGLLELKDFFFYKPGSIATEMPLIFRPKVQQIIARVTSPMGAFVLGMFVTLFLLPCTIGPYIILGGMLSYGQFVTALPYLSVYNLIFILPMVVIILIVFFGSKDIKQVSNWRERNIKIMHLIIGIIFILLGVTMFFGLF
jgi:cytochrome c biogenesis protein CcdA